MTGALHFASGMDCGKYSTLAPQAVPRRRLDRNDSKFFEQLEIPAIIGEQRQVVPNRSCANEKVHVANSPMQSSQAPAFTTEDARPLFVDFQNRSLTEKIFDPGFRVGWID